MDLPALLACKQERDLADAASRRLQIDIPARRCCFEFKFERCVNSSASRWLIVLAHAPARRTSRWRAAQVRTAAVPVIQTTTAPA